jgi:hypothetical protein
LIFKTPKYNQGMDTHNTEISSKASPDLKTKIFKLNSSRKIKHSLDFENNLHVKDEFTDA